uniref:Endonuclease/exonuclease/phosphatase domain-containing protein n=1 Tax=Hucho hucho TaxID=62062 RepID=A0A4W5PQC7_9TELE
MCMCIGQQPLKGVELNNCREKDSYRPHRVVQAWELQQFIFHTCSGADLVIFGKDLNMHPQDLGNRLLWMYNGLWDSYTETPKFDGSSSVSIQCKSLSTTKGSVPDHPLPYSDHEALSCSCRPCRRRCRLEG